MTKYLRLETYNLRIILFLGIFFRLIAVIFSKGWGMHDDHFLVIETAQAWVDGLDYNRWLPINNNTEPPGHSFFYPGFHYCLFLFFKSIHITDPQTKMVFVRLIHAAYSILVIIFGYKITEKLSDRKNAITVALLLSLYWFMPFLSVRNLAEMVCMPLLILALWIIISFTEKAKDSGKNSLLDLQLLLAGVFTALSFSIRFQTMIFIGGIVLVLLIQKKWKILFNLIIGLSLTIIIIEGVIDYLVWGYPFAEFIEYVKYNFNNAYNYLTQPWYTYLLFLSGILIPPVSIFLFIGYFKVWKKHLIIFLPSFLFLAFHSYFPNKQERFILTIIPFIIILGVIGWNEILGSNLKLQSSKFLKGSWIFFWTINLLFLPLISTVYSKKARVESMVYLSKYKNIDYLLLEGTGQIPARYYLGQWPKFDNIDDETSLGKFKKQSEGLKEENLPKFVLFYNDKNLNKRVETIKTIMPNLKYETTIEPGFIDKVLFKLNPHNSNQTIFIYKNHK